MSSSNDASREPSLEQKIQMTNSFGKFIHNASLTMLVLAPVLIALPPRKLDLYTFSLVGAFVASANQLTKERTGAGLLYKLPGATPPQIDESRKAIIREEMQKRGIEHRKEQGYEKIAKDIWMGGEEEGWKEKRMAEEQKKLDQGEGYGSMIVDQIWDVWNWGEKKAENLKKKDEQVVKSQLAEQRGKVISAEGKKS